MVTIRTWAVSLACRITTAGCLLLAANPSVASDRPVEEAEYLQRCASRACSILHHKVSETAHLKCELMTSWHSSAFNQTMTRFLTRDIETLRCSLRLEVSQAQMIAAISH